MSIDLTIEPRCRAWGECLREEAAGTLFGHALATWREKTRHELGLDTTRPIIATGHQTLLWHPGILVKYLAADAVARAEGFATANLIVDQHAGGFGDYEVPVRRRDGALAVRRVELTRPRPEVPMSLHESFAPQAAPALPPSTLASVSEGVRRIEAAIRAHSGAPEAATQMGEALAELMAPWVRPFPAVKASELLETSLAQALLREMTSDPQRCIAAYNEAVASLPEAGIHPLLVRDDYVELPLWRIRDDGRRMHAYDGDVAPEREPGEAPARLMPRALLMTALIRLGMCDLFVHGTGGANYDRAMVRWIESWLGVTPAPVVVASASLRLPLDDADAPAPDVAAATAEARRIWHDPEPDRRPDAPGPGPIKRDLLRAVAEASRGSASRRQAFFSMHRQLETLRGTHAGHVELWQRRAADARRAEADAAIARRRDWPFALYPREAIDELVAAVRGEVGVSA
ncbi:MAG: hypothetical protein ACYTGP_10105 [Planctomycetota bacterium]|jgi:hypothetical protein